jgi:amidase
MVGRDPADPLAYSFAESLPDFSAGLSDKALNGARIGVYRNHGGAGVDARVERILEDTIETLRSLGAEIVDPVEVDREGMGSAQHEVLVYEFKADLNAYLENSGAPINNLAGIIEFNKAHADTVMPHFGQETLIEAQAKGPLTDDAYLEALAESKRIARNGIDNALETHNLDALIAPTRGTAWLTDHINGDQSTGIYSSSLAAISGYASITVPAGDILGLPIGISFIGTAYSDEKLIKLAYAFEQGGYKRRPPFKNQ